MSESRYINANVRSYVAANDTNEVTCTLGRVSTFSQIRVECQITLNYLSGVASLRSRRNNSRLIN